MLDSYQIFTPGFSLGRFLLFPLPNSTKKRPVGAALIHADDVAMRRFTPTIRKRPKRHDLTHAVTVATHKGKFALFT